MKTVLIGGKFDPIHQGHIDYIEKASKLGDFIYVVINSDEIVEKFSAKKFCAVPLRYRLILINGILLHLNIRGLVCINHSPDGTVEPELRALKPDIFAKGGDRTPTNMPANEVNACKELDIEIVYGISEILNSSSKIWKWTEEVR